MRHDPALSAVRHAPASPGSDNRLGAMMRTVAAGLALLPALAAAQSEPNARVAEPLWEVGAVGFGLSQQAWPGSSETVRRAIAVPYVLYRGPLLRIDRGDAGLRAIKTEAFELDVGFSGALGSRVGETEERRGMPELGTLVEFGPRGRWNLGAAPGGGQWRFQLPLRGVFDVNDRFSNRGLALEPEIQWIHPNLAGWSVVVSGSALLGDRQLAGTFYDVKPEFATASRPAYEAQSGLIASRLRLTASQRLSRDWRVFGFGRLNTVAGAVNAGSPLASLTTGFSVGVGIQWTWIRSDRSASD